MRNREKRHRFLSPHASGTCRSLRKSRRRNETGKSAQALADRQAPLWGLNYLDGLRPSVISPLLRKGIIPPKRIFFNIRRLNFMEFRFIIDITSITERR